MYPLVTAAVRLGTRWMLASTRGDRPFLTSNETRSRWDGLPAYAPCRRRRTGDSSSIAAAALARLLTGGRAGVGRSHALVASAVVAGADDGEPRGRSWVLSESARARDRRAPDGRLPW